MWDEIVQKPLPVNSEKVAIVFISSCPTFRFDGVPDSIKVLSITREIFYASPDVTVVELEFDCFYAGYGFGGRGGFQPLAHHRAILDVTDGKVTSATIDGIWDEINQAVVDDKIFYKYYSTPEEVRDAVVWYSINNFDWTLVFPAKWDSITFHGTTGTDIERYSSGGWVVTVERPILTIPTYSVEVEYLYKSGGGFGWAGTFDRTGGVDVARRYKSTSG